MSDRYTFRGLLKLMRPQISVDGSTISVVCRLPSSENDEVAELEFMEVIEDAGDIDWNVYRVLGRILLHELGEGFFVDGKRYRDPHAQDTRELLTADEIWHAHELGPLDFVPFGNRVLVRVQEGPDEGPLRGRVLSVGSAVSVVRTGDLVVVPRDAGVRFTLHSYPAIVVEESDLLGKITRRTEPTGSPARRQGEKTTP